MLDVGVRVTLGDVLMEPAPADMDAALVLTQRKHLGPLEVVPLGLAGDDRANVAAVVIEQELVVLLGLPPVQALLRLTKGQREGQSLSSLRVEDEVRDVAFGSFASCMCTTACTRSRRSA